MQQGILSAAVEPAPAFVALARAHAVAGAEAALALIRVLGPAELGAVPKRERAALRRDLELALMAWIRASAFADSHVQVLLQDEAERCGIRALRPRLIPLQYRADELPVQARNWLPSRAVEAALAGLEEAVLAAGYR